MATLILTAELEMSDWNPIELPAPDDAPAEGAALALVAEDGTRFPAQRDGETIVALVGGLAPGDVRRLRLVAAEPGAPGVTVQQKEDRTLDIRIGDERFTTYHFGPQYARPFFYPVLGPGGLPVTRAYPMADVAGETRDHPHHRSFWTAYGEVSGTDCWSEAPGRHGYIRHQSFTRVAGGRAFGGFTETLLWTARDGKPLMSEERTLRVYATEPDRRLLDYQTVWIASHGDVEFGDTKEGGIIAFRVATTMDGNKGGRIENEHGGIGERECWGKRAAWVDYSGPVQGQTLGIAVMDHPGNFRHPTHWHVRDYGLFASNVFGTASFEGGNVKRGQYVLKSGERLTFRFRVLIHRGDAKAGKVAEAYHAYVQPPQAR